jgi:hypothetical protein
VHHPAQIDRQVRVSSSEMQEAAAPVVRLLSFSAGRKPVPRRQQHPNRFS